MNNKLRVASGLIVWLAIAIQVNTGSSQVTTFDTRASFDSAVGSTQSENFNSFVTEEAFSTAPLDVGPFSLSFTGTPSTDSNRNIIDIPPVAFSAFNVDGTNVANVLTEIGDSLLLTFDVPILAFGADFGGFNNDFARTGIAFSNELLTPPVTPDSEVTFFGFRSDVPFSGIEFRAFDNDSYGIDNVAFRSIPEPNGIAIIIALTIGACGKRRRKK